ncbi:MAG: response regulator [Bacteroidia bacterium]
MKKVKGKLILVDDEDFEKELLIRSLQALEWDIAVEHFNNPEELLKYLKDTKETIFLIISDMDMPEMNGLELKKAIDQDEELKIKSIPFIFSSTSATKEEVFQAYQYGVQGYFEKPMRSEEMAEMLDRIIKYWIICRHPNKMAWM